MIVCYRLDCPVPLVVLEVRVLLVDLVLLGLPVALAGQTRLLGDPGHLADQKLLVRLEVLGCLVSPVALAHPMRRLTPHCLLVLMHLVALGLPARLALPGILAHL